MYEQVGYIVLSKDEKKILTWGRKYFLEFDKLNGANIRVFRNYSAIDQFFTNSDFPRDMIKEVIIKKVRSTIEEVDEDER